MEEMRGPEATNGAAHIPADDLDIGGQDVTAIEAKRRSTYANLLVDSIRRHTILAGDLLDRELRFRGESDGVKIRDDRQSAFSSQPAEVARNKTWSSIVATVFGLVLLQYTCRSLEWEGRSLMMNLILGGAYSDFDQNGPVQFVLQTNTGFDCSQGTPDYFSAFGVNTNVLFELSVCSSTVAPQVQVDPDNCERRTLTFAVGHAPKRISGFFVVPQNTTADVDLELMAMVGGKWKRVERTTLEAGTTPGGFKQWSLNTPWPAYVGKLGTWIFWTAICLSWPLCRITNTTRYTFVVNKILLGFMVLCRFVAGYGYLTLPSDVMASERFMTYATSEIFYGFCYILVGLGIAFFQRHFDFLLVVAGYAVLTLTAVMNPNGELVLMTGIGPIVATGLLFCRIQILISAWFGLSEHRKASKQTWKLIQESTSRISDLNRAVRDLKLSIPAGTRARQFNVRLVDKTMLLKVRNALGRRPSVVDESEHGRASIVDGSDQKIGRTQSVDNILADETGLEIIDMLIGQGKAVEILQQVLLDRVDLSLKRTDFETAVVAVCSNTCKFELDYSKPIASLDQLWTQATLVRGSFVPKMKSQRARARNCVKRPGSKGECRCLALVPRVLIRKLDNEKSVLRLASLFGGGFPLRNQHGHYMEPQDTTWDPMQSKLRMGGIKPPLRGIEKTDSEFSGDPSRILDACRETIVFQNVDDMRACVNALMLDEEVTIVRVINSMEPGQTGKAEKGHCPLRFVSINLRISNEQTRNLAVENHICELRLILREFANLWTPEFQRASVRYRNSTRSFRLRLEPWECRTVVCELAKRIYSLLFGGDGERQKEHGSRVAPAECVTSGVEVGMVPSCGEAKLDPPPQSDHAGTHSTLARVRSEEGGGAAIVRTAESNSQMVYTTSADRGEVPSLRVTREPQSIEEMTKQDGLIWNTSWGVKLGTHQIVQLERVCRFGVLGLPTALDTTLTRRIPTIGQGNAWTSSMFFTEHPTAIAKLRWVQFLSLAVAAVMMQKGTSFMNKEIDLPKEYLHYRYTSFKARNGSKALTPGVSDFVINHVGQGTCDVHVVAMSLPKVDRAEPFSYSYTKATEGPNIYLSFDKPAPFAGFALHYPGPADTSNFAVYASKYDGARGDASLSSGQVPEDSWELVGTPQWFEGRLDTSPRLLQIPMVGGTDLKSVDMPDHGGFTIFEPALSTYALMPGLIVDANTPSVPRDFHLQIPSRSAAYSLSLLLFSLSGILGRVSFARLGIMVGLILSCAISWVTMISFFHRSENSPARLAIGWLFFFESPLLLAAFLWKRHARKLLTLCIAVSITSWTLWAAPIHPAIGSRVINFIDGPWHALASILVGISMLLGRYYAQRYAQKLVEEDKRTYDELWAREVEKDEGQCSLKHLAEVVKMLGLDQAEGGHLTANVPQLHRKLRSFEQPAWGFSQSFNQSQSRCLGEDTFCHSLNMCSIAHSLNKSAKVYSYGQLYIQALVLQTALREKLQDWAMRSQGFVPIKVDQNVETETEAFAKWQDVEGDSVKRSRVKWPPLKKSKRGIEKLARVYGGDVSRLVDITRFSLYFDSFTDLTLALGVIVGDFEIKVERVKSRMSLEFDGQSSAGYRDILLNVRLCTKETGMLGCDTHICEIQLILRSFGELKTAQGHQRYAMFRDLRAE